MKNSNHFVLWKFSLITAFAIAISATATRAQTLIVANLADPSSAILQTGESPRAYENKGDLGFVFQVGSNNLLLTDLGVYAPSTGLPGSTAVDVYAVSGDTVTSTDPLVASATVTAGTDPDSQGFAYAATIPTVLLAGDQYAIYYVDSSVDKFYDATFSETSGSTTQKSELFDTSDIKPLSNILNGATAGYDYYVSANAEFTGGVYVAPTPEPSSIALLLAGGFAALAFIRLRRKA